MASRRLGVVAVLVLAGFAASPAAQADEVRPYNPAPPVYAQGCNYMAVGTYDTLLSAPQLLPIIFNGPVSDPKLRLGTVSGRGDIKTSGNTSCSRAKVQMALQTKACGRVWRCTWEDRAKTDWVLLPVSGELSFPLSMTCREGVNSYRVLARVSHIELDFEETPNRNQVPFLDTKITEHEGQEAKGSC